MPYTTALFLSLLVGALLTGLIWMVQLVHYPGFAWVGPETCKTYQQEHTRRISWLVVPLMLLELGLSLLLLWMLKETATTPTTTLLHWLASGCVWLNWLITFLVFVPLHRRLQTEGYIPSLVQKLVSWNWPRTLLWSLRLLLLSYLYMKGL